MVCARTGSDMVATLANAFQSLYDGAYDNIMDKQNKYDSETEHGTIPDKQDEWNKKYE